MNNSSSVVVKHLIMSVKYLYYHLWSLRTHGISSLNFPRKFHVDALYYETQTLICLRFSFISTRSSSWHVAKFLFVVFRPPLSDIKPQFVYAKITLFDTFTIAAYFVYN